MSERNSLRKVIIVFEIIAVGAIISTFVFLSSRSTATTPLPPPPQTVTAKFLKSSGTLGQSGYSLTYRILWRGVEECPSPATLMGFHGGGNYILHGKNQHLDFLFSDASKAQIAQWANANPQFNEVGAIIEEKCWGGFDNTKDCTGQTVYLLPLLNCVDQYSNDPNDFQIFEYRVTFNRPFKSTGSDGLPLTPPLTVTGINAVLN